MKLLRNLTALMMCTLVVSTSTLLGMKKDEEVPPSQYDINFDGFMNTNNNKNTTVNNDEVIETEIRFPFLDDLISETGVFERANKFIEAYNNNQTKIEKMFVFNKILTFSDMKQINKSSFGKETPELMGYFDRLIEKNGAERIQKLLEDIKTYNSNSLVFDVLDMALNNFLVNPQEENEKLNEKISIVTDENNINNEDELGVSKIQCPDQQELNMLLSDIFSFDQNKINEEARKWVYIEYFIKAYNKNWEISEKLWLNQINDCFNIYSNSKDTYNESLKGLQRYCQILIQKNGIEESKKLLNAIQNCCQNSILGQELATTIEEKEKELNNNEKIIRNKNRNHSIKKIIKRVSKFKDNKIKNNKEEGSNNNNEESSKFLPEVDIQIFDGAKIIEHAEFFINAYNCNDHASQIYYLNAVDDFLNNNLTYANFEFLGNYIKVLVIQGSLKFSEDLYEKIQSIQKDHSCLKMILLFVVALKHNCNLDKKLDCTKFIKNMQKYVIQGKETALLSDEYLKYVLPIMQFFTMTKITTLNLANKDLSILPQEILLLRDLEQLDIRGNNNLSLDLPVLKSLINKGVEIISDGNDNSGQSNKKLNPSIYKKVMF